MVSIQISNQISNIFRKAVLLYTIGFSSLGFAQSPADLKLFPNSDAPVVQCDATEIAATEYMVPLDDLQDVSAVFEMKNLRYKKCANKITVQYELPRDLTGEKNVVRMTGLFQSGSNSVTLDSNQGRAVCVGRTDGALKCNVEFRNLSLNPIKARDSLLKNEKLDSIDFKQKMDAIGRFTGNPVGFFTVQFKVY
jgi:hypothetical protein